MADGYIQVYPDSTGKRIDASELTVNALTVERQRMAIGDNTGAANIAAVVAPYTQGGYGLAVQRFQDAGRAYWSFSWDAVAGVTSEALVSGVANLAGTNAGIAVLGSAPTVPSTTRTTTDTVGVADSVARATQELPRSVPDTLAASDAVARDAATRARTVADAVAAADAATPSAGAGRAVADTLTTTDSVVRAAVTRARTAADTVTVADGAARLGMAARTTTDTVTAAATINTGGPLTDIWWGESGAVANVGPYWMDNIIIDSAAYPGP